MYRVNGYARCTTIKMTGGLSYCLYIVAAITLHTASSSSASYTDINNLTDTDSNQFQPNMETSNFKNSAYWLDNDKTKSQKQTKNPKRPFWETSLMQNRNNDDPNQRDVEEWETMMRKVTDEQLKKWESKYNSEKILKRKNNINGNMKNMSHDQHYDREFLRFDPEKAAIAIMDKANNVDQSAQSSKAYILQKLSDLGISRRNFIGKLLKYQSDRWGMSGPPNKFLQEISENSTRIPEQNVEAPLQEGMNNSFDTDSHISSRFLPNDTSKKPTKLNRKKSNLNKPKNLTVAINDTTTNNPILSPTTVSPEPKEKGQLRNINLNINDKIPSGVNVIDEMALNATEGKSRIFAPIFIFGPTMWIGKLPKAIKQKLKVNRVMNLLNGVQSKQTNNNKKMLKNSAKYGDTNFSGVYELL